MIAMRRLGKTSNTTSASLFCALPARFAAAARKPYWQFLSPGGTPNRRASCRRRGASPIVLSSGLLEALERSGNLLRRPLPVQQRHHQRPKQAIRRQFGRGAGLAPASLARKLSAVRAIRRVHRAVARQLAADGRGRAPKHAGDGPHTQALLAHARNRIRSSGWSCSYRVAGCM